MVGVGIATLIFFLLRLYENGVNCENMRTSPKFQKIHQKILWSSNFIGKIGFQSKQQNPPSSMFVGNLESLLTLPCMFIEYVPQFSSKVVLALYCITSQNGQTDFKNLAAFKACLPFWYVMH